MIGRLGSALAGGVILALTVPPFGFSYLAWIAFIPLLYAVDNADRNSGPVLCGMLFGLAFSLIDLNWVYWTVRTHGHFSAFHAAITFLALAAVVSIYPTLFGAALGIARRRSRQIGLVAPFAWTAVEYARANLFTGFPWDLAGYSQSNNLHVIQIADFSGVYGITFLVMLVNSAGFEVLNSFLKHRPFPWRICLCALILVAGTLGYGSLRINAFSSNVESGYKIGILQGNIPQELKWDEQARTDIFEKYEELSVSAVRDGAKLLIWPETSVPAVFGTRDPDVLKPGAISDKVKTPMLVGAPSAKMVGGKPCFFNSALLINGHNVEDKYDKVHLVPFGEYMPLSWLLPLGPGIAAREVDYCFGDEMKALNAPRGPKFSVLICYEAIFPELSREAVNKGANLLVNITNDAWFGGTAAPYQHLAMVGLRAVETRRWLVRSANTGISAVFDPLGRMRASLKYETAGYLVWSVPMQASVETFYSKYGDLFAWGCILVCLYFLAPISISCKPLRLINRRAKR